MSMELDKLNDDDLSAAVAEHVAGWKCVSIVSTASGYTGLWHKGEPLEPGFQAKYGIQLQFATSACAVLPLLEKQKERGMWIQIKDHTNGINCGRRDWLVIITDWDDCCDPYEGEPGYPKPGARLYCEGAAPTFPRAACIALLRAKGIKEIAT